MARYGINKGVGREVEFKGLRARYLFVFAGGLAGVFVLFVVLYMAGVDPWACIAAGLVCGGGLTGVVFRLNRRYGSHGLAKAAARHRMPRRIAHRRAVGRLLRVSSRRERVSNENLSGHA